MAPMAKNDATRVQQSGLREFAAFGGDLTDKIVNADAVATAIEAANAYGEDARVVVTMAFDVCTKLGEDGGVGDVARRRSANRCRVTAGAPGRLRRHPWGGAHRASGNSPG